MSVLIRAASLTIALLATVACGAAPAPPPTERSLTPTYSKQTGRLEQLTSDRNGDGRVDTWAFMNGSILERVEIDRDGDGIADRFEHYETRPEGPERTSPLERAVIVRAEETAGENKVVVRREIYEQGILRQVEEDTDRDGRINRWETYEGGSLARMDLDLQGKGVPTRRLIYGRKGVERVEVDPEGDGTFVPAPSVKP